MNETKRNLYDRKQKAWAGMQAIAGKVKKGETITAEERAEAKRLQKEFETLEEDIQILEQEERISAEHVTRTGVRVDDNGDGDVTHTRRQPEEGVFTIAEKVKPENRQTPAADFVLRNYNVSPQVQKASVWKVLRAMHPLVKTKLDAPTKAALDECRAATGTALLTEFLSAQLLDGGLSQSHCAALGMQSFAMVEGEHRFAKISTYPVGEWLGEYAQSSDKSVVFSSVDFDAKTLRFFCNVSGELAQDGANFDRSMRQVFTKTIGNSIDTAALIGAGTADEPEGIANYTNVNKWTSTTLESYDDWVYAIRMILEDDGVLEDITGTIMHPNVWRDLALIKGQTDLISVPPPWFLANHQFKVTSKIPTNLGIPENLTEIFIGGWRSLMLGVRLQTSVIISPVQSDRFQYSYMGVFRGDIKPEREENFALIQSVYSPDVLT